MYQAIVAKLEHIRKHSNANRLQLATVTGYQIIIGLDNTEGEVGIFFPTDGVLTKAFAVPNDLIRRKDENGKVVGGGLFDENCRVRAQKLRGEISEGFWMPLSSLNKVEGIHPSTILKLKVGDQFDTLDGVLLCQKFYAKVLRGPSGKHNQQKKAKEKNICFPEHFDTKHFRVEACKIPQDSLLYLSEKIHGTSSRYGYVLENTKLTWFQRLLQRFGVKIQTKEWTYVAGTRRVELHKKQGEGFHGTDGFRYEVMKNVWPLLRKGELIFGEIVGYTDTGAAIQSPGKTKAVGNKEFTKKFGELHHYNYGCPAGTCKLYVYRIAMVNEDGIVHDLPWPQVKKRCEQLGLAHVPEVFPVPIYFHPEAVTLLQLEEEVKRQVPALSLLSDQQIREGICIRIENEKGITILKEKAFAFRVMEEGLKDEGKEDIEETEDQKKEE